MYNSAYANFTGKDASRALAKSVTELSECNDDLEGLNNEQLKVLDGISILILDWFSFYEKKYEKVGVLID